MIERTARCLCGATALSARGEPGIVFACCCHDCQLRSGSVMAYSAFFPEEAVETRGSFSAYAHSAASGRKETTRRCETCGTPMWFTMEALPGRIGIPAGIFRDPAFPPPGAIYFTSRRHDWLPLPEGIAAKPEMS